MCHLICTLAFFNSSANLCPDAVVDMHFDIFNSCAKWRMFVFVFVLQCF